MQAYKLQGQNVFLNTQALIKERFIKLTLDKQAHLYVYN